MLSRKEICSFKSKLMIRSVDIMIRPWYIDVHVMKPRTLKDKPQTGMLNKPMERSLIIVNCCNIDNYLLSYLSIEFFA